MLALLGLLTLVISGHAESRFAMCYLADVGHLGSPASGDRRRVVDLGVARAYPDGAGVVRLEGKDRRGKPWRLWLPQVGGFGWTEVWGADFDADGQQDLLIASHFPGCGRCIDGAELVVLLFEQNGRPMPWHQRTRVPEGRKFPFVPAIVMDLDGNGRAEIVTTSCEYADGPGRFSEDRSVTGVYQAQDARWLPLREAEMAQYVRAAKASHPSPKPGFIRWLPATPQAWDDPMSGLDSDARVRIARLIPVASGCGGVRLIVKNGRVAPAKDPCRIRTQDRVEYSDGRTSTGWPPVVIDASEGRDIYVARSDEGLRRILRHGYACKLLGRETAPSWVWAGADVKRSVDP